MRSESGPQSRNIVRYAGIATQLLAGIGISVYGGRWLDKKTGWSFPVFIWLLPLLVVIVALYKLINEVNKQEKNS